MKREIEDSLGQALLILWVGAVAFVISGCADSSVNRTYKVDTAGAGAYKVELNFYLDGIEVVNETKTAATQSTTPTLRMAQNGGAINDGAGAADGLQDNKDNRVDNRVNTTTTYITNPKVGEGTAIEPSETPAEYLPTSEVIVRYDDCKQVANRSHHWLYEIDLTALPKSMKVTYPNCGFSFIVEDTSKSQDFPDSKLEKGSYYAGGTTEHGEFPAVFSKAGCTDNSVILESL